MKYMIYTLGCKVNNYESEYVRSLLENEGFVFSEISPDIIIVNTCTVTNNSDKKSKKLIRSLRVNNKEAILVAIGCYVQYVNGEVDADIVLGNKDKSRIVEYIYEFKRNREKIVKIYDMNDQEFEDMCISKYETHTRAFVKIEDGCNNFCSYCIIPYVRGRVRCKSFESIISEVKDLVKSGHKEIVLTGIHTGQYKDGEYKLNDLIKRLTLIPGLYRLRLSSIEVVEVSHEIIELLKNSKVFVSHLHIPLQSGSDAILKLMNRRYNKKEFKRKIEEIRKVRPQISITTDLIVGFNGEGEREFKESYDFCKSIGFSKIHVFPFSLRDGTRAQKIEGMVDPVVKKRRVNEMLCLSKELELNYYSKFFGSEVEVLVEEVKDGYSYGYTENYIKVKIKGEVERNTFKSVIISEENIVID